MCTASRQHPVYDARARRCLRPCRSTASPVGAAAAAVRDLGLSSTATADAMNTVEYVLVTTPDPLAVRRLIVAPIPVASAEPQERDAPVVRPQ